MSINQTILQGQGVGQQIGGVSAATTAQVQASIAQQAENRAAAAAAAAAANGTGGGGGGGFGGGMTPQQDWSSMAWLILGMM